MLEARQHRKRRKWPFAGRPHLNIDGPYRTTLTTVLSDNNGSSLAMVRAVTATQPCVGVKPGRARWKKIALPRPRKRGAMFQSSTRQTS